MTSKLTRMASAAHGRPVVLGLIIGVLAGCGYPALPQLVPGDALDAQVSDAAAAVDGSPVDGPPQFTSCSGLAMTCGPGANESCCRTEAVPGGTFLRGYDGTVTYPDMGYPATVSGFELDVYEVTVGRFRAFVNAGLGTQASSPIAGAGAHPRIAGSGWDAAWNASLAVSTSELANRVTCNGTYRTWTDEPGVNETRAMNCVTWYEAMAFCIWDGGYLPTEAEWAYAAGGGSEQRAYPWSSPAGSTTADCTYANYYINEPVGTFCVNGVTGGVSRVGSVAPKGNGRWQHADLAGDVYEWVLDWHADSYALPCNDCAQLTPSNRRVMRGGSFTYAASELRVASRDFNVPDIRLYDVGFRCARTP